MVDHCTHKRREPESQEMRNSLIVPCYECVPLPQSVESTFDWVPLTVRIPVISPKILCFGPKLILTLLCLKHLRKDRPIPGDSHFTVRRSPGQGLRVIASPPILTTGAWLLSYPKQM